MGYYVFSLFKFLGEKHSKLRIKNLDSYFVYYFSFSWCTWCQKPAHYLSAEMALVSTFFQLFIVLGMYNFGGGHDLPPWLKYVGLTNQPEKKVPHIPICSGSPVSCPIKEPCIGILWLFAVFTNLFHLMVRFLTNEKKWRKFH